MTNKMFVFNVNRLQDAPAAQVLQVSVERKPILPNYRMS